MRYRKGVNEELLAVMKEFLGVVMLGVTLYLLFTYLTGQGFGCTGNEGCEEAREELERFVNDVNQACQNDLGEGGVSELGEYDFGKTTALSSNKDNVFRIMAAELDVLPDSLESFLKDVTEVSTEPKWEVTMKAEECEFTHTCLTDVETCHNGDRYTAWPFYLMGDAKGKVTYHLPEDGRINLRWVDHEFDIGGPESECGPGASGSMHYACRDSCDGSLASETNYDDQCDGGQVCCKVASTTP